jgi:hypothetical protein
MLTLAAFFVASSMALVPGSERPVDARSKPIGGGVAGVACPCPGDFDGSGGIDGADLAALLGAWGSSSHDLDGSGTTDAADLSILLGGWGPCSGAPVNDLCENAITIVEGDTPVCTIGAGTDAPPYTAASGCIEFGYNSMTSDVWYSFVAPEMGEVTISTCGAGWDTRLAVYADASLGTVACPISTVGTTEIIACNDDHSSCGNGSLVSFNAVAGQEYKIRVGGFIGWSGEGVLHLDFHPLGGVCNEAIDLGIIDGAFLSGSTLIYEVGLDQSPCGLGDTISKWYMFAADCGHQNGVITMSTCHDGTDFDTTLSVWKSSPVSCPGTPIACNDDFADPSCVIGGLNRRSRVQFTMDGPALYFVRVSGYNGAAGNFELSVDIDCN